MSEGKEDRASLACTPKSLQTVTAHYYDWWQGACSLTGTYVPSFPGNKCPQLSLISVGLSGWGRRDLPLTLLGGSPHLLATSSLPGDVEIRLEASSREG